MEQAAVEAALKLSDLSSFIEVSIGINLLYSFWKDLRLRSIHNYQAKVKESKKALELKLPKTFSGSRDEQKLNEKSIAVTQKMTKLTKTASVITFTVACSLLSALAWLGFEPNFEISCNVAIFICLFAALPSILFIAGINIYLMLSTGVIKNLTETLSTFADDHLEGDVGKQLDEMTTK